MPRLDGKGVYKANQAIAISAIRQASRESVRLSSQAV
jgi:hypothetical protein